MERVAGSKQDCMGLHCLLAGSVKGQPGASRKCFVNVLLL